MQIKLKCSPSFNGQSGGSKPKDKDRSRRSNKYSIPMSANSDTGCRGLTDFFSISAN